MWLVLRHERSNFLGFSIHIAIIWDNIGYPAADTVDTRNATLVNHMSTPMNLWRKTHDDIMKWWNGKALLSYYNILPGGGGGREEGVDLVVFKASLFLNSTSSPK